MLHILLEMREYERIKSIRKGLPRTKHTTVRLLYMFTRLRVGKVQQMVKLPYIENDTTQQSQ